MSNDNIKKISTKKAKDAFQLIKSAKEQIKALESQKAQAEEILREALGEATEALVVGLGSVSLVSGKNTSFDRDLMKEQFPEAFDQCLKTKEYTYIKVS